MSSSSYKIDLETYGTSQKVGITKLGSFDATFPSGYVVPEGVWTHLAFSSNGTETYLYVNGVLKDSLNKVISMPMGYIGNSLQSESPNGYVDEIRFWNVVRTQSEISSNMNMEINPATSNLIGYWRADGQTSPAMDVSTNSRTGQLQNGATYITDSIPNFAVSAYASSNANYAFDLSANRNSAIAFSNGTNIATPWTAELWVYKKATTSYSSILSSSSYKIDLETYGTSQKVGITQSGSFDATFPSGYVVPVGVWTHLAFSCDGTKTYLYVNGSLKDSLNKTMQMPMSYIGNSLQSESPNAFVDEVRFWNGVRAQNQISADMNIEIDPSTPNLIGYWRANDLASPANDSSSNHRTGALLNGATYTSSNNSQLVGYNVPATIDSVNYTTPTQYLMTRGSVNQEILETTVHTSGAVNSKSISSITLNLEGTDKISDIKRIKLFNIGSDSSFKSAVPFATVNSPSSATLNISTNNTLFIGLNNIMVTVDIDSSATLKDKVKAICTSISFSDGTVISPNPINLIGSRTIDTVQTLSTPSIISIIPVPQSMIIGSGNFLLNASTSIVAANDSIKTEADFLASFLRPSTGFSLPTSIGVPGNNVISFEIISDATLGEEGYTLNVTATGIDIQANTRRGLFWGIETLRQLLPPKIESKYALVGVTWNVPVINIKDFSTYEHRGSMLDVCRHFFTPDEVKKYIDMLALYKINYFHWHLSEDQGFRIESKKYPELNTISSWRNCPGTLAMDSTESVPYGGYYTQDQIKDIVAYATTRHITVIPEIEFTGHSVEILAAHPELACTSSTPPFSVRCAVGVSSDMYCAGKDTTFNFIESLLDEIIPLFPGKYFHIGGDETPFTKWETCTDCLKRIQDLGLTGGGTDANAKALKSYFLNRIITYLTAKGKTEIGWTEVYTDSIKNSNVTIQDWLGGAAKNAAKSGNDVIISNVGPLYFDAPQSNSANEPPSIGYSPNTLADVYNYTIMPSGLTTEQQAHIKGAEAPLWTEMIPSAPHLEYMLCPRIQALAENTWSKAASKNLDSFENRLYNNFERWDSLGFSYRPLDIPATAYQTITIKDKGPITLSAPKAASSYYWTDAANSRTQNIRVTQSGYYIVYYYYLGQLLHITYNVTVIEVGAAPSSHLTYYTSSPAVLKMNKTKVLLSDYSEYFENLSFTGGYAGIQQTKDSSKGSSHILISSLWDPNTANEIYSSVDYATPITYTGRFGGEGDGYQSIYPYNWEMNVWYNTVVRSWISGGKMHVATFVQNLSTGKWLHTVTLSAPSSSWTNLGSGNDAFVENWLQTGGTIRKALYKDCWNMTQSGTWQKPATIVFSSNSGDSARNGSFDRAFNAGYDTTEDAYFMQHGGSTTPSASFGTGRSISLNQQINQGTAPTLTVGAITSVTAFSDSSKIIVNWTTDSVTSPQLSAKVEIIDGSNNVVKTFEDTLPQRRSDTIPFTGATNAFKARVTIRDIFNQLSTPVISESLMPVTLLSFEGIKQTASVLLTWQAASEINFNRYVIERSVDKINYHNIGSVPATNLMNYSYTDRSQTDGVNYYRLKLINNDNSYSVSKVISINFNSNNPTIKVLPNPVNHNQPLKVINSGANDVTINFFTSNGKQIKQNILSSNSETDIYNLPQGVVFYKAFNQGKQIASGKVIVK